MGNRFSRLTIGTKCKLRHFYHGIKKDQAVEVCNNCKKDSNNKIEVIILDGTARRRWIPTDFLK